MSLTKNYNATVIEPELQTWWLEAGIYHFDPKSDAPVYSIDTPPPTVSGNLHLGHVYSYSHADFIARFWRMNGYNVYYPMGYDDNGHPTDRLVEKRLGIQATQVGRKAFTDKCLQVSEEAEKDYQALWQRLGLSIDWRYSYRTIDVNSQRLSQWSFMDLYQKGLVYRQEAPAIWCPECGISIAQADLNDLDRESEFVTIKFTSSLGELPIATTRPELLPACVAIFVHPKDERYQRLISGDANYRMAVVPIFGQTVPILADSAADPQKGSGAVMCCTFGDATDVTWWRTYKLPLRQAIDRSGKMTSITGEWAGLTTTEARKQIKQALEVRGHLIGSQPISQTIRIHERCDTPVEYIVAKQWFVKVLEFKDRLLSAGEQVKWHPEHMAARYRIWVENLNWDWCISRQRYFGIPFPVWYCQQCGEITLAEASALPVDPMDQQPSQPCAKCGATTFTPETDTFDTWATSSLTPQIAGRGRALQTDNAYAITQKVCPYNLHPQAHDIIRTWAFYTILKSQYHFETLPWTDALLSGWGIAGVGMGKISKSRGGGPMAPLAMIEKYSADAVRYWAASTGPGKDSVISEEKIQMGAKLVTKLWNVARFAARFIEEKRLEGEAASTPDNLSPADRWILSRLQKLIRRVTELFRAYDYANAKSEIETFFWTELADNYLEMAKQRLYDSTCPTHKGARWTLQQLLFDVLKLFAPFLPNETEAIYQEIRAKELEFRRSIHKEIWPVVHAAFEDEDAEKTGMELVEIATAVRRYKSENNLPLGTELPRVQLVLESDMSEEASQALQAASDDLKSITRAQQIEVVKELDPILEIIRVNQNIQIAIDQW